MPDNIPEASRILLVNPTKYLGNLLIAGGLIQEFSEYCRDSGRQLTVVLDSSYEKLVSGSLGGTTVIYYPRSRIYAGNPLQKIWAYLACVRQIREVQYDLAFVLEEDAVAHRLIQFCRARYRLGCAEHRHKRGFNSVIPVNYRRRSRDKQHRWYCYQEVFRALGMISQVPSYIDLKVPPTEKAFLQRLGLRTDLPVVIIHAGASRDYKKWPVEYFVELIRLLQRESIQPVLVGAGTPDKLINQKIVNTLAAESAAVSCVDLCNIVNLEQLARLMKLARAMVGNDSGPFHLGSALGLPGITLYGPTEPELWGPLGRKSKVIQGNRVCAKACREPECIKDHACLKSLLPQRVFSELVSLPE